MRGSAMGSRAGLASCYRGHLGAGTRLLSGRSVAVAGLRCGRWEAVCGYLSVCSLQRTLRPMNMMAVSGRQSRITSAVTTRAGSIS